MKVDKIIFSSSEARALEIAVDELDCYIGVMSEDIKEVQDEAHLEKLRWASQKLHTLLASSAYA